MKNPLKRPIFLGWVGVCVCVCLVCCFVVVFVCLFVFVLLCFVFVLVWFKTGNRNTQAIRKGFTFIPDKSK